MALPQPTSSVSEVRKLDSFHNELISLSEKLDQHIQRLDQIAIRFRGQEPKNESDNKKMEPKPYNKIEELYALSSRIDTQLVNLSSLITDLERI